MGGGGKGGSLFAAIYSIFLFTHPKKEREDDKERQGGGRGTNKLFAWKTIIICIYTNNTITRPFPHEKKVKGKEEILNSHPSFCANTGFYVFVIKHETSEYIQQ